LLNVPLIFLWQESYFTYGPDEDASLVDPNICFRAGEGVGGVDTFTPRTVIYDLKGAFGSLRKVNALYEAVEEGVGMPKGLWYVLSPTCLLILFIQFEDMC
jgi:hypothetical protein